MPSMVVSPPPHRRGVEEQSDGRRRTPERHQLVPGLDDVASPSVLTSLGRSPVDRQGDVTRRRPRLIAAGCVSDAVPAWGWIRVDEWAMAGWVPGEGWSRRHYQ
jgi:hypothetical protein